MENGPDNQCEDHPYENEPEKVALDVIYNPTQTPPEEAGLLLRLECSSRLRDSLQDLDELGNPGGLFFQVVFKLSRLGVDRVLQEVLFAVKQSFDSELVEEAELQRLDHQVPRMEHETTHD